MRREKIRSYNQAFAFCYLGAKEHHLSSRGPPTFRISGQVHHLIGSLLPTPGQVSQYAQIYFHDTSEQVAVRNQHFHNSLNPLHLGEITHYMQEVNPFAQFYENLRSREDEITENMVVRFQETNIDRRTQNAPTASNEVAVLMTNENFSATRGRDVIVKVRGRGLQRIAETNGLYDPLMYPLLFPHGDLGWNLGLQNTDGRKTTCLQYYKFQMMIRDYNRYTNPVHVGGNLAQQYWVDQFAKYETGKLQYIRHNQRQIRAELYQGLADSNGEARDVGRRIVLPASVTGSERNMRQKYLDAMAMIRKFGKPDLFITVTTNPKWPEIQRELLPGQTASDRPDIVCRVFAAKFKEMLNDILKGKVFGNVIAYNYTVEFQKRGLPHIHLLLILEDKIRVEDYDKVVSAEIPDREQNPQLYDSVASHMMHGPCGNLNFNCVCMQDGVCTKDYPKEFVAATENGGNGFPKYRRRSNGRYVLKRVNRQDVQLDNRWVIPFNPYLVAKYDCHINVEICCSVKAVKYLYKYVYKGSDRASITVSNEAIIDEIQNFVDARYVSACEACWRLLDFPTTGRSHSVERLPVHLPRQHQVLFQDNADIDEVTANQRESQLTRFFRLCANSEPGAIVRQLTYTDLPLHYRWERGHWVRRAREATSKIARMYSVSMREGERFYLRILLNKVKGPTCFEDVRTYRGVVYNTFREAAIARGLLQDDQVCVSTLTEGVSYQMPFQLRNLFATILMFGNPTNVAGLWVQFKDHLGEDFEGNDIEVTNAIARHVNEYLLQYQTHWNSIPGLPVLDDEVFNVALGEAENNLIAQELDYDERELQVEAARVEELNEGQLSVFNRVTEAVVGGGDQNLFFVDGPGGTGKSFTYGVICASLRSEGKIVLNVASSGIAASLLVGGRTGHSRFKIPIRVDQFTTCNIPRQSPEAQLIRRSALIIWDEAPMTHRYVFEAVDRTLRDIIDVDKPFGGKVVLFGGDFRQTLPVVRRGTPGQVVAASLRHSNLWNHIECLTLTQNMRVDAECQEFANFLLNVGNGTATFERFQDNTVHSIGELIHSVFTDIETEGNNPEYYSDRVILSATNANVDEINEQVTQLVPGEAKVYESADTVAEQEDVNAHLYPTEFLNSLTPNGIAAHSITLKVGMPVMLLRNLNTACGLCNGTRLIIRNLQENIVEAEIMHGAYKGTRHFIPRIIMDSSDDVLPFVLRRLQFPIRPCYAMTINKSQGQTLQHVGLNLERNVFSHGQLYVAMSRVQRPQNLRIYAPHGIMNVVYRGALT